METAVLMLQIEGSQLAGTCSPLDRIHDEDVASIKPQKLLNRIYVSQNDIKPKFKQPDSDIALYGKAQYIWRDKTSYSKGYNWNKLSENFLFHKQCFQILYNWHWRLSVRGRRIAHLTETFICFSDWVRFFLHQYQKILPALLLWDIGGNNGVSLKTSGGQPQFSTKFLR